MASFTLTPLSQVLSFTGFALFWISLLFFTYLTCTSPLFLDSSKISLRKPSLGFLTRLNSYYMFPQHYLALLHTSFHSSNFIFIGVIILLMSFPLTRWSATWNTVLILAPHSLFFLLLSQCLISRRYSISAEGRKEARKEARKQGKYEWKEGGKYQNKVYSAEVK